MTFDEALDELDKLDHPEDKAIQEIPEQSGNFEVVTLTEEQMCDCTLEEWELDALFAENPPL